ncbi:hypothetical protein TNCV_5031161 [Trichonephila clavipes]|nr:hypothetical protein TNCV_5031161 [Trichonephila clavipes]
MNIAAPVPTSSEMRNTLKSMLSYTRAFGDGPRNFEPWSSDVDDTLAGTPSPNYHTTPTGGRAYTSE